MPSRSIGPRLAACRAATLVALGAGCAGEDPPRPGDLALVVGTGAPDGSPGFVAHPPGGDLDLAPGAQGGFHVFVNARLEGAGVELVSAHPLLGRVGRRVDTGELVSRATRRERLVERVVEGRRVWDTESSLLLFLCPTPIGVGVADALIELRVEARDPEDEAARVEGVLRFVPRCPMDAQAAFCASICRG